MQHASVPTTCTASQIIEWNIDYREDFIEKAPKNSQITCIRQALQNIDNLIRGGYKQDFDLIFAIITQRQYDICKDFILKCGFTEVYQGRKSDNTASRHKETGSLHMFTVHPIDYKVALDSFKKELLAKMDVLDPPMVADPERAKYPPMELKNFYGHGIIRKKAEDVHSIRTAVVDLDKFKALLSMQFGTDFSDEDSKFLGCPLEQASIGMLLPAQNRWKEEKIILLSEVKKRKAA
jgi:hypothetical protein